MGTLPRMRGWCVCLFCLLYMGQGAAEGAWSSPPQQEWVGVSCAEGLWTELEISALPTAEERKHLRSLGVELVDYIAKNRYWSLVHDTALKGFRVQKDEAGGVVYVTRAPGASRNVELRAVMHTVHDAVNKAILEERVPEWARTEQGLWQMVLSYRKGMAPDTVEKYVREAGGKVGEHISMFRILYFTGTRAVACQLGGMAWVGSVSFISPPAELHPMPPKERLGSEYDVE